MTPRRRLYSPAGDKQSPLGGSNLAAASSRCSAITCAACSAFGSPPGVTPWPHSASSRSASAPSMLVNSAIAQARLSIRTEAIPTQHRHAPLHRKLRIVLHVVLRMSARMVSRSTAEGWYAVSAGGGGMCSVRRQKRSATLARPPASAAYLNVSCAYGVMTASWRRYLTMREPYVLHAPRMSTETSDPCHRSGFSSLSSAWMCGALVRRSRSSVYALMKDWPGLALRTVIGCPVVCLAQMRAILAPSPNLPRAWRTPYLVPLSTRPSMLGMSSCAMPLPLSFTVTR